MAGCWVHRQSLAGKSVMLYPYKAGAYEEVTISGAGGGMNYNDMYEHWDCGPNMFICADEIRWHWTQLWKGSKYCIRNSLS